MPQKKGSMPSAPRKRKPPKALQEGAPKLQQEKPKEAKPKQAVAPAAPPEDHGKLAKQLQDLAASEPDSKVAQRLNHLAGLSEAFSKPKPPQQSETTSVL